MCALVPAIVGAAVVGAGASLYKGAKQRKAQRRAQASAERQAERDRNQAARMFNRENQKQPAIAAMMDRNRRASGKGVGSTLLTGPSGVQNLQNYLGGGPSLLGG